MSRVLVAMSGGVDSSVAALLCLEAGYEVIGATMQIWPQAPAEVEESYGGCCSLAAVYDARRVCDKLGVPHYVFNLRQEFEDSVIADFCAEYERGRTPNPCIVCNRVVKFEHLLERAIALEADFLATGHYARVEQNEAARWLLKRALYPEKDQSYALYALTQQQLSRTLFPVGSLSKQEVRNIAKRAGLEVSSKPESQDICFVVSGRYTDFLRERCAGAFKRGPLVDVEGRVLGYHNGIANFTVGQRKGLGISAGKPLYVLEIRPEDSTVVVGTREQSFASGLLASRCNWIAIEGLKEPIRATVKIRYKADAVPCRVIPENGHSVLAYFDEPQRAVTPGQAAVFYDGEVVIGGGTIERAIR